MIFLILFSIEPFYLYSLAIILFANILHQIFMLHLRIMFDTKEAVYYYYLFYGFKFRNRFNKLEFTPFMENYFRKKSIKKRPIITEAYGNNPFKFEQILLSKKFSVLLFKEIIELASNKEQGIYEKIKRKAKCFLNNGNKNQAFRLAYFVFETKIMNSYQEGIKERFPKWCKEIGHTPKDFDTDSARNFVTKPLAKIGNAKNDYVAKQLLDIHYFFEEIEFIKGLQEFEKLKTENKELQEELKNKFPFLTSI